MAMTAREILVKARELIADPDDWGQGDDVGRYGKKCPLLALSGAAREADDFSVGRRALVAEMQGNIVWFNDTHSHAEVLNAFYRAIARAAELEVTP